MNGLHGHTVSGSRGLGAESWGDLTRLVIAVLVVPFAVAIPAPPALASGEAGGCAGGFTKDSEPPESKVCTLHLGYAGAQFQTVVVPPGVHTLSVVAIGAPSPGGGLPADEVGRDGGTFTVRPGEELQIAVGGRGERAPENATGSGGAGGYGGGGAGGSDNCNGCIQASGGNGGGGGSFVFGTAGKLLAVAGGAGGGGSPMDLGGGNGGFGGGLQGGHGNQGQHDEFTQESVEAYGGLGATQAHGGAGGLYIGSKWSNGQPRATKPGAGGGPSGEYRFGQGGEGGNGTPNPTGLASAWAGGGGGGGYYGGGGGAAGYPPGTENATPSTDGGGGGGAGYVSPEAAEPFNSTFHTPLSDGEVILNYDLGKTLITGRIDTPFGDGLAGAAVRLSGQTEGGEPVELEAKTSAGGTFHFYLDPGTYTVTPVPTGEPPDPGEYRVEHCDGTAGVGTCADIDLLAEHEESAEFNAGYTLKGQVLSREGRGEPGATVLLQDTEQGVQQTVRVLTNQEGRFSERLAPGTVLAATQSLGEREFFPEPGPDCKILDVSCEVNLDRERQIGFTACVLPNPDGEPLPADTPAKIPGAQSFGDLEAVGCWAPQNQAGSGEATIFKSTKPVRLNGIDVVPEGGSALILNASGPTVTSTGKATIHMAGWQVTQPLNITLNYQGGSTASVSDQGAGTGPLAPNLFGLPISLGSGGPAGYGLPFSESAGQTTLSTGLQLPQNTHASWDPAGGVFKDAFGTIVPSLGLGGALVFTNRYGLTGNICLSANDIDPKGRLVPLGLPDSYSDGEISGVQVCYKAEKGLWEGSGMFKLPTALAKYAGDIYVKLVTQKVQPGSLFSGYRIQSFGLEFDHLKTTTFVYPGYASIRSSGIPIGLGFYLQSLGGEFTNNLTTGAVSSVTGTAGISYGPEVNVGVTTPGSTLKGTELSLLRGQLAFTLVPSTKETPYWTYKLGGTLTLARLSPLELQLASASIAYHANPVSPEADFTAKAGLDGWGVGGTLELNGQSDVPNGFLLEGTGTVKALGRVATADLILNNFQLGFCAVRNGEPVLGFSTDLSAPILAYKPNCNLGAFKHPKGASASAPTRVRRLTIAPRLPATMLAVRSLSGTPAVTVAGPGGLHIEARAVTHPQVRDHALLFANAATHTLYVGILAPRAGRWAVTALPGSPAVAGVLQATPQRGARLHAKVKRAGCADEVRYRATPAPGERELLYARQGTGHVFLGDPHPGAGRLRLKMLPAVGGRGKLIAYYLRGTTPVAVAHLASFPDAAANGSERPGHPRLAHRQLSWSPACAASSYEVLIVRRGVRTTSHTTAPRLPFTPAAPTQVTVTALTADGHPLGSRRAVLR